MSTIAIRCKMFLEYETTETLVGERRLIIPDTENIATVYSTQSGGYQYTWNEILSWCNSSGFTCFNAEWFQPSSASSVKDAIPFPEAASANRASIIKTDVYTYARQWVSALIFQFTDKYGNTRRIKLSIYDPEVSDPDVHKKTTTSWEFILNGVTKLTLDTNPVEINYYSNGANEKGVNQNYISIPWLHNIEETGIGEIVGCIDIRASTIRFRESIASPWKNGDSQIYAAVNGQGDAPTVTAFKEWLGVGTEEEYHPEEYTPQDNPFDPGGNTGPGGGGGNFSDESDIPDEDALPDESQYSANASGFITLFNPTLQQLRTLAGLFWNATFAGALRNFVENITDMFISLALVPFTVPPGSTKTVTWFGISTGVDLRLCAQQFYDIDMGEIDLTNDTRIFTSGSTLDYSPYSQLGIYLPFIGYRELDIDECRDGTISLSYRFDLLSGECVAIVKVNGASLYTFTGNCLCSIPITSQSMDQLINAAINVAVAGAAGAESAVASAGDSATQNAIEGNVSESYMNEHKNAISGAMNSLLSATANNAMAIKPRYSKSGSISGSAAMLSVLQPFLFLKTPRQAIPEDYNRYCGYPSNITGPLGSFSGYTVVEDIRLNGLVATSAEVSEIYELLKKGVII